MDSPSYRNSSREGGLFHRGPQSSSTTSVTFLRRGHGPFKTVRNFTKKPVDRRRSLQPVKLPDGTEDPDAKTRLTQDGEGGQVAARNIAWTVVFAPPQPTEVIFTIVHSGEYGKGAQEGLRVPEFKACTYTFTADHSTFDIDIELLASKETALLKKRPSGLSILARAQKNSSGELLGDSPPVTIQGPNRRGSGAGCSTPSPTLPLASPAPSNTTLHTPEDPARPTLLEPRSQEHAPRVTKPTPNRAGVGFIMQRPESQQGYGLSPTNPDMPGKVSGALFSPLRGHSPGTMLVSNMQELCLRPQPVLPLQAQQHFLFQQDLFTEDSDGRQNKTVHSHPWMSPLLPTPRGIELAAVQDPLVLEAAVLTIDGPVHSENEEPSGTALRKRHTGGQLETSLKARKLHSGDKDFTGGMIISGDDAFNHTSLRALVPAHLHWGRDQEGPEAFIDTAGGDEIDTFIMGHSEAQALPDLFITEGSQPGVMLHRSQSLYTLCELEAAASGEEDARAKRPQSTPPLGLCNAFEPFSGVPRMSLDCIGAFLSSPPQNEVPRMSLDGIEPEASPLPFCTNN